MSKAAAADSKRAAVLRAVVWHGPTTCVRIQRQLREITVSNQLQSLVHAGLIEPIRPTHLVYTYKATPAGRRQVRTWQASEIAAVMGRDT